MSIKFPKGAFTGYCVKCSALRIFIHDVCCKCGTSYPNREDMSYNEYIQKYFNRSSSNAKNKDL